MAPFRVAIIDHGYPSVEIEREVVTRAGGEFIDADELPEPARLEACAGADAILVRWLKVGPELMQRLPQCKILVRYGVGYDNIDSVAATEAGIMVGHIPDYCYEEVAFHTLALLLDCIRNVTALHQQLARGGWNENPSRISHRLRGRTLGLVGLGNIGQAVARRCRGWELRLIAADPYLEPERAAELGVELVDLTTLCRTADYVSVHVPLLPETRHLLSRDQFALMRPGVIVINTARGPVIDGAALLAALNEGRVAAAGLDVFEQEPLPADSPFRSHPRVVATDHIAWYSEESERELKRVAAEEAVRVCRGELPLSIANPEVLRKLGRFESWTPNTSARWQLRRQALLAQGRGGG